MLLLEAGSTFSSSAGDYLPFEMPRPSPVLLLAISSITTSNRCLADAFSCDKSGFFGKGKDIPEDRVNDDYCDCADGTDEPATNACALLNTGGAGFSQKHLTQLTFRCADTKGYEPLEVPSHMFGDGVCDCCDGSDEPGGKCVDECAMWFEADRAKREAEEAAEANGRAKYQRYADDGSKAVEENA